MKNIQEVLEKLEDGVKGIYTSDKYLNYLKFVSQFHNYSYRNTILISMQKPEASLVKGFMQWKEIKRFVKKGEKAITILAPQVVNIKKEVEEKGKEIKNDLDEKTETTKQIRFRPVKVFDISQTDGEPIPSLVERLKGTSQEIEMLIGVCKDVSPVKVKFENIEKDGVNGFYSSSKKEIVIKKNLEPKQALKTLIHEMAHSLLHDVETNKEAIMLGRDIKELQAESIAYVVSDRFGIDTSQYSFGYIASWAKDKTLGELKENFNTIQKTSSKIIQSIEEKLELIPTKSLSTEYSKTEEISRPQSIKKSIVSVYKDDLPSIKNISLAGASSLFYLNIDHEKPLSLNKLKNMVKEQNELLDVSPNMVNLYKLEIMKDTINELQNCKIAEQRKIMENKGLVLEPS